ARTTSTTRGSFTRCSSAASTSPRAVTKAGSCRPRLAKERLSSSSVRSLRPAAHGIDRERVVRAAKPGSCCCRLHDPARGHPRVALGRRTDIDGDFRAVAPPPEDRIAGGAESTLEPLELPGSRCRSTLRPHARFYAIADDLPFVVPKRALAFWADA